MQPIVTYFIVFSAFVGWLLVAFALLLALRLKARGWSGRPYVFQAVLWASIGVLVANALLVALLALGVGLFPSGPEAEAQSLGQGLLRFVWGALAILGPFLASAVGWFAGLFTGLFIAHGRLRNAAGQLGSRANACVGR